MTVVVEDPRREWRMEEIVRKDSKQIKLIDRAEEEGISPILVALARLLGRALAARGQVLRLC